MEGEVCVLVLVLLVVLGSETHQGKIDYEDEEEGNTDP